jgi:hypothetical protein
MTQSLKAAYFQALKNAGVAFDRHYREYSTDELKLAYDKLTEGEDTIDLPPVEEPAGEQPAEDEEPPPAGFFGYDEPVPQPQAEPESTVEKTQDIAVKAADPNEMAGQRLNSQPLDEPIRVDPDTGRAWFQEEILKPAYPKPRGRRVLTYLERGVKQEEVHAGQFMESFEVAGDGPARVAEVRITLPSYQVGIFKDPRFPFKVHTYNGLEGFDLFEVRDYYGGAELVPETCKLVYVENVLCYDIRSVVRAIEAEYRHLVLTGKVEP